VLFHCFQQSSLGLGGGPVDFVGENDLSHDRPRTKLELHRLLVVDGNACHIGRKHVRGELNAAESATDGLGEGAGQHGLAHARNILNKDVTVAEQAERGQPDLIALADNHIADVVDDLLCHSLHDIHAEVSFTPVSVRSALPLKSSGVTVA